MAVEQINTALEIDESIKLHQRSWKMQPYAWALIFLFVLAGLLGVFGEGWLSSEQLTTDLAEVKYESALRQGSQTAIEVHDRSGADSTEISFPSAYLAHFSISSIVPQPAGTEYQGSVIKFLFKGSAQDKQMVFYLQPERSGRVSADISINAARFHIANTIFP